jgi:hypothetical protein
MTGPSPALRRLAAWVFVASSLVGYVRPPAGANVYLRTGEVGLAVLTLLVVLALNTGLPARTYTTVITTTAMFLVLVAGYALLWPLLKGSAFGEPSLALAASAAAYCSLAVAYACVFYQEDIFLDTFWRAALIAVCVGLAAYGLNAATGSGWLVHRQYGTPRLQGLLSEPSAWAPFMPALVLLSLDRRRYVAAAVPLVAAALTKSPTVVVGLALSIPAYYALADRWRARRPLVLALSAGVGALAAYRLVHVNTHAPLSASFYDQVLVRLAGGVENVTSGGTLGTNDRFAITRAVFEELANHGWLAAGIGPGSERYLQQTTGMVPNSLATYVLSSFGIVGLLLLAALLVRTVVRSRAARSLMVFLPFIAISFVNSADGWESYKYVVVAVALAGTVNSELTRPARQLMVDA